MEAVSRSARPHLTTDHRRGRVSRSLCYWHRGGCERLRKIGDDVVDVLDADRQADVAGRHAAG